MNVAGRSFNSTGKRKEKRIHRSRMTEYLKTPQPTSVPKEREKNQPLRIAQLLDGTERPKSAVKSSVRKQRVQPERLGLMYSTKKSECHKKTEEKNKRIEPDFLEKNVRRNLNIAFGTEKESEKDIADNDLPKTRKKSDFTITTANKRRTIINDKLNDKLMTRKSSQQRCSILPPNTIKETYKKQRKSTKFRKTLSTRQEIDSTDSNEISENRNLLQNNDVQETDILNLSNILSHTSTPKTSDSLNDLCFTKKNNDPIKITCKTPNIIITPSSEQRELRVDAKIAPHCLSRNTPENKNVDTSIALPQINFDLAESVINLNRLNGDSFNIDLNDKESLKCLGFKLKHIIQEAEESVSKLKRVSNYIEKLVSPSIIDTQKELVDKEVQVSFAMDTNEEVQASLPNKGLMSTDVDLINLNGTLSMLQKADESINLITFDTSGVNKESYNEFIQNMIEQNNSTEDSFLKFENEFDILHPKNDQPQTSCVFATPKNIFKKEIMNKGKRSLREYMLLKSRIRCLETPDTQRFQSRIGDKEEPTNKTYLSNQVLAELQNLYTESPECKKS